MEKIDIVSVVNDFNKYNKYFIENENVNKNNLIFYDNTIENISITKRFNDYIDQKKNDNTWIVFCHQDFHIQQDLNQVINNKLNKNAIYGPIGAGTKKQFAFFIRLDGLKIAKFRIGFVEKQVIKGQIIEDNGTKTKIAGCKVNDLEEVNTLDCCCFILHSDLIKEMNYRFDENLEWHLYAEDLCLQAFENNQIKSKILNIESTHFSSGNFNIGFKNSLNYLISKYPSKAIVSTCYDGVYKNYLEGL